MFDYQTILSRTTLISSAEQTLKNVCNEGLRRPDSTLDIISWEIPEQRESSSCVIPLSFLHSRNIDETSSMVFIEIVIGIQARMKKTAGIVKCELYKKKTYQIGRSRAGNGT